MNTAGKGSFVNRRPQAPLDFSSRSDRVVGPVSCMQGGSNSTNRGTLACVRLCVIGNEHMGVSKDVDDGSLCANQHAPLLHLPVVCSDVRQRAFSFG
jgi:hypothetical protein